MKVLFVSNLFPDASNPHRGIYNAQMLHHLRRLCEIKVIAPRPTKGFFPFWFPKKHSGREQDGSFAPVFPAAAYIPKIGSRLNHLLMARSLARIFREVRANFPFEVVLSAWIYPDACAVAELSRENNLPFIAIAQGSDVHQYLKVTTRRKIILNALSSASGVLARSEDLARQLARAGVARNRIHVIYNGVDSRIFASGDRAIARKELNLPDEAEVLLFVGNFLKIKNPLLLIEAHADLCRKRSGKPILLVMIGAGPLTTAARRRARELGTSDCLLLVGAQLPEQVARYMRAANLLCVPSQNEGVPNVILEAFACGLPVVARNVGGIPEVLCHDFLGRTVMDSKPATTASAMAEVLGFDTQHGRVVDYARRFSWEKSAEDYFGLLQSAVKSNPIEFAKREVT